MSFTRETDVGGDAPQMEAHSPSLVLVLGTEFGRQPADLSAAFSLQSDQTEETEPE